MTWLRRNLLLIVALAVLAYMLVPNIVVAVFSFNDPVGRYNYTWTQFSVDAWANPCGAAGICDSLGLSLRIGAVAALTATALGTMIAFALGRYRFRGRAGTNLLIFMPMATPEVVMGSSLLTPDFVKTSTGFASAGANVEHIALMRKNLPESVGIKASGGIKNYDQAFEMIQAGADRIGTSSGIAIVTDPKNN